MATPKSISWVKNIRTMFRYASDAEREIQVQAIRLYVLYEDLKIEWTAAEVDSLPLLEGTSKEFRRFYFVRRTFGTLFEISGAMQALEGYKGFPLFKERMDDKGRKTWDEALKFFRTNHEFLKACRNDVGGHFQADTAKFALDGLEEDHFETVEIYRRGEGADARLKFAYYLVACGLVKNRPSEQAIDEFLNKKYFPFLVEASQLAIHGVQVFAVTHLLPK
jgi:hypothetical protein